MPRINLLPWREQQRTERKMAFTVGIAAAAVGALIVAGAGYLFFNSLIEAQVQRNQLLTNEIRELDKKIEEINSLETQKQQFIARMQIIEKLQRSRPEIVHVFDTFVKTIPDGTYLTAITQTNSAQSRACPVFDPVSSSYATSTVAVLKNPELEVVESKKDNPLGSDFTLFADQVTTLVDESKTPAAGAQPVARAR